MHDACCVDKGDKKGCSCGCVCGGGTLACIGRIAFALPLFIFGIFHFLKGEDMVGVLSGWPFPLFLVYVSGAGLVLAAIAIALNRYARLAALLLAAELLLFVLTIHLSGIITGGTGMQMSIMSAMKDLALVGGALVIAAHMGNRGCSTK